MEQRAKGEGRLGEGWKIEGMMIEYVQWIIGHSWIVLALKVQHNNSPG
ncbi:MAG: hypothetical protein K0M40_11925 [Prolixibacteraceae bacterium]|nr:hypothetical protein [Prolixibacteraceae bacterium]